MRTRFLVSVLVLIGACASHPASSNGGDAGLDAGTSLDASMSSDGGADLGAEHVTPDGSSAGDAGTSDGSSAGFGDLGTLTVQPTLAWARMVDVSNEIAYGTAVAPAPSGGAYTAGYYYSTALFGQGEANQTLLTTVGNADAFVARYDSAGALVWARDIGGVGHDHAMALTTLSDGSVVVSGDFTNTITIGVGIASAKQLTATATDIFLARFSPDGEVMWARRAGQAAGFMYAWGLATHSDDSFYVVGVHDDVATLGPGEANQTVLPHQLDHDAFVARYAASGNLLWAKTAGGPGADGASAVSLYPDGSSVVAGSFEGTCTFGPGELKETSPTSAGKADVFVARYATNGDLVWVKTAGGAADDKPGGVAALPSGGAAVAGNLYGAATFGAGEANQTALAFGGSVDIFVAQLASDGKLAWAKGAGASNFEYAYALIAQGDGSVLLGGTFYGTTTFGAGEATETMLTATYNDGYLAKYSATGAFAWVKRLATVATVQSLAFSSEGNLLTAGEFGGTATFGPGDPLSTMLASSSTSTPFVASWSP